MVLKEDFYGKIVFSKKESDFMQDSQKYTGFLSRHCAEWTRMDRPSCQQGFSFLPVVESFFGINCGCFLALFYYVMK